MSNTTFRRGTVERQCPNGPCSYATICFRVKPIVSGDKEVHAAQCLQEEIKELGKPLDNYLKNGMPADEARA